MKSFMKYIIIISYSYWLVKKLIMHYKKPSSDHLDLNICVITLNDLQKVLTGTRYSLKTNCQQIKFTN